MVGLAIGQNRVNDHPVSRYFVKNRVWVSRQFQPVKRVGKDRSQARKIPEQIKDVIEIDGKDFTST